MTIFTYISLFLFWAIFGSFGSLLIRRLKWDINKEVLKGIFLWRSECPKCKNKLWVLDLFPIFSRIFLWGKCRHCKSKVSSYYPFLEFFSGLVFMFSYRFTGQYLGYMDLSNVHFLTNFVNFSVVNWVLLLLFFADILFFELNVPLWTILVLWIIFIQFFQIVWDFKTATLWWITFFVVFYFIYWFSKFYVKVRFKQENTEWFGEWDVMVAFAIGLLIPFLLDYTRFDVINIIYIAFFYMIISSVLGLVFSLFSLIFNKWKYWQAIPFLPAMIVWFWIMMIFIKNIEIFISSYLNF